MKRTFNQWMVINEDGELYAASNADCRAGAVMHHESSTGYEWKRCYAMGDRLIRVTIKKKARATAAQKKG